jgi:hypothetical protein
MALEQWEVELRKQLKDSSYTVQPKEKTWEDRLREQISNVQPTPPAQHHAPKKNNNAIFLMVILVLLGAVAFAVNMKTGVISNLFKSKAPEATVVDPANPFEQRKTDPVPPGNNLASEVRQIRIDVDRMKADNNAKFEDMQKKIKWNGDRITLLGMMHNENWLVIRNQGANSSQFLYFNGDWTLSGMPQYLQLTADDQEFLEKYRKK